MITTVLSPTQICRIACPSAEIKNTAAMMTNTAGSCKPAAKGRKQTRDGRRAVHTALLEKVYRRNISGRSSSLPLQR